MQNRPADIIAYVIMSSGQYCIEDIDACDTGKRCIIQCYILRQSVHSSQTYLAFYFECTYSHFVLQLTDCFQRVCNVTHDRIYCYRTRFITIRYACVDSSQLHQCSVRKQHKMVSYTCSFVYKTIYVDVINSVHGEFINYFYPFISVILENTIKW